MRHGRSWLTRALRSSGPRGTSCRFTFKTVAKQCAASQIMYEASTLTETDCKRQFLLNFRRCRRHQGAIEKAPDSSLPNLKNRKVLSL